MTFNFKLFRNSFISLILLVLSLGLSARVLIISDLDDTIKITGVKSTAMITNYLTGVEPFENLISIYRETIEYYQANGEEVDMVYLTAAPRAVNSKKWLADHHAPKGLVIERRNREVVSISGKEHKLKALSELMQQSASYSQILLFGDNGENDPVVYLQTVRDFGLENKAKIYIRDVMVNATELYQGMLVTRLPSINYFLVEAQLLNDFTFLSAELQQKITDQRSTAFLPDFMQERLQDQLARQ